MPHFPFASQISPFASTAIAPSTFSNSIAVWTALRYGTSARI